MKSIFNKTKVIILFLVIQLLCSLVVYANENVEFVSCNILQKRISSIALEEVVQLRTVDVNGVETTYSCAERVRINGTLCKNTQDIYDAIAEDSFVRMAIEDGVVTILNFSDECVKYDDVEYKEKKGCFNILNSKQAGLPVYYRYGGNYVKAHTDGNHLYDIEVYDYAICITNIKSKTGKEVIDDIDIGSAVAGDFTKTINIYCESDALNDGVLCCELYDDSFSLIGERKSETGETGFGNLNNETSTYTVKFWIEDKQGKVISSIYVKEVELCQTEVKDVYVSQKRIATNMLQEVVQLKVVDANGVESTYDCADRIRVNGTTCKQIDNIYSSVCENSFSRIAVENGVVKVLNFYEDPTVCDNAEYDSETMTFIASSINFEKKTVFYKYNDAFVPAYTDENHLYDIQVYENAVCITDMKPKTEDAVIDYIEIGSLVAGDFTKTITVYCESDALNDGILCCELYDENGTLAGEINSETGETNFRNLKNEKSIYTVKLWLEDAQGEKISSEYVMKHVVRPTEIKDVVIVQKRISDDNLEEIVHFRAVDVNGAESTYTCAERVRINGTICRNNEDIYSAVSENSYAKIAVEDGVVSVLNFDSNKTVYSNAEYDSDKKIFTVDNIQLESLPVYYKYNDAFVPVYTDENHYYDIEVCDYAVCITDIKSKTGEEVIKLIEVSTGIASDFSQIINAYCETDSSKSFVLNGKVYDEKNNLISFSEGECVGSCELLFDNLKNKSENCTVKLWLEDESGKKVSATYICHVKLFRNKIKYGNVVVQYTSEDDTEKLILNFRSIDGFEEVYVCDNNTNIINEPSLFSLRTASISIPENSFVKIAACDGIISAIQIEPKYVDICALDFNYSGSLNGKSHILNNSDKKEDFVCYIAAYDNQGVMKCCSIAPVTLESGDFISVSPEFNDYKYSQGDYLKIFALSENNLIPLSKSSVADIVGD